MSHKSYNNDRQHNYYWFNAVCSETGNYALQYSGSSAIPLLRDACSRGTGINIQTKYLHIYYAYGTCKKSKTSLTCITKLAHINNI